MFKKNFINLCNKKGVSPSAVCQQIGLSNAAYSSWTDESVPRKATLMRIADYFGVPVESLLSDADSPEKEKTPDPTPSVVLDSQGVHLTPEEVQIAIAYRTHPELQPVVRKLLDIPEETEKDTDVVS